MPPDALAPTPPIGRHAASLVGLAACLGLLAAAPGARAFDAVEAAAALAAHGHSAPGGHHGADEAHGLPVEVLEVRRGDRRLTAVVRWTGAFDPVDAEHVTHVLANLLPDDVDHLSVVAREPGGAEIPVDVLIAAASPGRPPAAPPEQLQAIGWSDDALPGALDGRVVVLSPGHGWFTSPGYWATQRGWTFGLKEDFITQWIVSQKLVPMLERAGATVWVARERDFQAAEIRLDDAGAGGVTYAETGSWAPGASPGGWSGAYRVAATTTAGAASSKATFSKAVPSSGWYGIYGWWVAGNNRVPDAHVVVHYAGGEAHLRIDQTLNSRRWVWLGRYWFEAGQPAVVEVHNDSASEGFVVADAFRLGGGVGDQPNAGLPPSGYPRWEESASVWVPFSGDGAKAALAGQNDVVIRPKYADFQGGDVYVSVHSNAAGSPNVGTGTDTFIHDTAPSAGSAMLRSLAHDEILGAIKTYWDPAWKDRGKKTANFGEVRELKTMPGFLLETAFHDTELPDNKALGDADFRELVARGIYKGILRYLEGDDAQAIPLPPDHVWVRNDGAGHLVVGWQPVDDLLDPSALPSGFRVWVSPNGRGFSLAATVNDPDAVQTTLTGLTPGSVVYVQVTAWNAGGESLPTEVLAARVAPPGTDARILVVNGFDRLDKAIQPTKNTRDFVRQHAAALAAAGEHFDAASNEAIVLGLVDAGGYALVDWILGEESTADETFSASERPILDGLAAAGVSVVASGAEIAWDLGKMGTAAEAAWLADRFGATFFADAAGSTDVAGVSGALGEGLAFGFHVAAGAAYEVAYADVFGLGASGGALFEYEGGGVAGVLRPNTQGAFVLLGFPFEAVAGANARVQLMTALVQGLVGPPPEPVPVDPGPEVGPEPGPEVGPEVGPEPGPEPTPDLAPEPGPEVEADASEPTEDGETTVDLPSGGDAGAGDVAPGGAKVVTQVTTASGLVRRVDEGCGAGRGAGAGWMTLTLAALALLAARRRARGARG